MSRRRRFAPLVAAMLITGLLVMWCARPMRSQETTRRVVRALEHYRGEVHHRMGAPGTALIETCPGTSDYDTRPRFPCPV